VLSVVICSPPFTHRFPFPAAAALLGTSGWSWTGEASNSRRVGLWDRPRAACAERKGCRADAMRGETASRVWEMAWRPSPVTARQSGAMMCIRRRPPRRYQSMTRDAAAAPIRMGKTLPRPGNPTAPVKGRFLNVCRPYPDVHMCDLHLGVPSKGPAGRDQEEWTRDAWPREGS
jgi:hypothetical protein